MTRPQPRLLSALALAGVALVSRATTAQADPKYEFAKPEEVKTVEWKATAKGGLLVTTGNSETTNGTIGAGVSRKEGNNKLALEGAFAYGKSRVTSPTIDAATNQITSLQRQEVETTNNWMGKGRYDRFFTPNNAGYALGDVGADKVAGKTFAGGGQVGYSRQLLKNAMHLLVAELGYDFSYERYVQQAMRTIDPVSIHSARVFVGEALKLSDATGMSASVEALFNLNREGAALNVNTGTPGVDAFKDTRVNGKLGLTTTLHKDLSVGVGFTLKYDQNPAPRPVPPTAPMGATFAPGFQPFSDKVDTQTEITLMYAFL